jgi:hypothetical protein
MWSITQLFKKKKENKEKASEEKKKNKLSKKFSCTITTKEQIILDSLGKLGAASHQDILKEIYRNGLETQFDLRSNWKETWKIMKKMVDKDVLTKEGKVYSIRS